MNKHAGLWSWFFSGLQRVAAGCSGLGVLALLLSLAAFHPAAHAQVPLTDITQIAAGSTHTCALTTGRGVKCWGLNSNGQLGDGTTSQRLTAVDVSGLSSGVSAIAAGGGYTCALTTGGGVKCWGANFSGQLGDGTTTQRLTPVDVIGLTSGVIAIGAGSSHTCAVTTGGGVKCWGANSDGQLGDGTTIQRLTPVDVSGLSSGVSAIAPDSRHTCALTTGGGVKCWGFNATGQLGDGTSTQRLTPVDVSGLSSGVSAIAAAGLRTCALTTSGGVKCWGFNNGTLGDGTTAVRLTPVDVIGLSSGVSAIATGAGASHTCALTTGGGVKCWGFNATGQLGDSTTTNRLTPVDVSGLSSGVSAIAAGGSHTCAVTTGGAVKCWGLNSSGQLGDGTTSNRLTAVDASGLTSGVGAIAAGNAHTCAVTTGGGVKCWGDNLGGQLGDGTTFPRLTPVDVSGLSSGVGAIATGSSHTCALTTGGGVKCWGNNFSGQLGDGTTTQRLTPVDVIGLTSGVSATATGGSHTCAVTTVGAVKCWGFNNNGQLGDGTTTQRLTPVDVGGLGSGVSAIAVGTNHACALTTGGGVKCWGVNATGQLGDSTTTQRLTAVDVSGLNSGFGAIAAGGAHTCALATSGGVRCWGSHQQGQLGIGGRNYGLPGDVLTTTTYTVGGSVSGLGAGLSVVLRNATTGETLSRNANGAYTFATAQATGATYNVTVQTQPTGQTCTVANGSGTVGTANISNVNVSCMITTYTVGGSISGLGAGLSVVLRNATTGETLSRNANGAYTFTTAQATGATYNVTVLIQPTGQTCTVANGSGTVGTANISNVNVSCTTPVTYTVGGSISGLAGLSVLLRNATTGETLSRNANGAYSFFTTQASGATYNVSVLTQPIGQACTVENGSGTVGTANISNVNVSCTTTANTYTVGGSISGLGAGLSVVLRNATTGETLSRDANGAYTFATALPTGATYNVSVLTQPNGQACTVVNGSGTVGTANISNLDVSCTTTISLTGITQIAASGQHTCALTTGGGVRCWGNNSSGQLGDGTTTQRLTPVDVSGLNSGVSIIVGGGFHTCALTNSGGVRCWGSNQFGQLGDGTTTQRTTPVDVSGLTSGVSAIATGSNHTCALTIGGGVKCWGINSNGRLGDGTTTQRLTPVDVIGLTSGVSAIAAGGFHTCALTTGGGVKCWGLNSRGQVGDGTTTDRFTPVDVSGLSVGVNAIAAGGEHTCALTTSGGVRCWGANFRGQLGDGTTANRLTPMTVSGLSIGVSAISLGQNTSCALTSSNEVKCWGINAEGQLGDGTATDRSTAVDVSGLTSGVSAISAGLRHTCVRTSSGGVQCWGLNDRGQLGDGTTANRRTPMTVSGLSSGVSAISAGFQHSCALVSGIGVKCWGNNGGGRLGDGTSLNRVTAVDVSGLGSGLNAIAAGSSHSCALTTGGGVKCWGSNSNGQLGDGTFTTRLTPVDVSGLSSGVSAIAAGGLLFGSHTCALTSGGGVKCWGTNADGQLGDGTVADRSTAVDVSGLTSGISAIAAGDQHTCALTTGGGVKCWGRNSDGQLGDGTTTQRLTPVDVSGLASGVSAIAAGGGHTCAITTGGGVKCWGANFGGSLGDGTTTRRLTQVDVIGLASGVSAITVGFQHSCALTSGGGVRCWGANFGGQLGDGTDFGRLTPVNVSGLTSGVSAIEGGDGHTCALTTGGGIQCWGSHQQGQLGIGGRNYGLPGNVLTGIYTVGGSISGLGAGLSVTLRNATTGETLSRNANGAYTFATAQATGATYDVTVQTQPTGQTCTVVNGSGTVGTANISNVDVSCTTNTYTVGGSISGLGTGLSVVLRNATTGETLSRNANGAYSFATAQATGASYDATVQTQPTGQTCTVANGSGTVGTANISNVDVSCTTNTYTVGGSISGLGTGLSVVLRNATTGENLSRNANGAYTFATAQATGATYEVTVQTQPTGQTCTVANGSGTVGTTNISNVDVSCTTNTYTVGGSISGLGTGLSVVLRNATTGENLSRNANGAYTFATAQATGATYDISVQTQPTGQTCSVANGSGTVGTANISNVDVSCTTNTYTVGGSISGLGTGLSVVLRNATTGETLSRNANGAFTFATAQASGATYDVSVQTQPTGQTCTVANGAGTVGTANISNVNVSCTTNTYTVGGSISGLGTGLSVVLRNATTGETLSRNANGAFTFATVQATGATYDVTVQTQPTGQTCTVANGSGTVGTTNISNVNVSCTTTGYFVGGSISGLGEGRSVVLRNATTGETLSRSENGAYIFATAQATGATYDVTVQTQPAGQTCTVANGSGTVGTADIINVNVSCATINLIFSNGFENAP